MTEEQQAASPRKSSDELMAQLEAALVAAALHANVPVDAMRFEAYPVIIKLLLEIMGHPRTNA